MIRSPLELQTAVSLPQCSGYVLPDIPRIERCSPLFHVTGQFQKMEKVP